MCYAGRHNPVARKQKAKESYPLICNMYFAGAAREVERLLAGELVHAVERYGDAGWRCV